MLEPVDPADPFALDDGGSELARVDTLGAEHMPRILAALGIDTADCEVRGKRIRRGDTLGLFYASANFDEAVFADPFEFDISRKPNRHLAFGTGPHQCLGLILARMEMRIFFEQLIPRIAEMTLAGEPQRLRASFVHGFKHLPIRYRLVPA